MSFKYLYIDSDGMRMSSHLIYICICIIQLIPPSFKYCFLKEVGPKFSPEKHPTDIPGVKFCDYILHRVKHDTSKTFVLPQQVEQHF